MSLSPHRCVRVDLGPRSYDVLIGRDLLDQSDTWAGATGLKGPVAIITDVTVSNLYAQRVEVALQQAGLQPFLLTIPPGESSKSMEEVGRLLSKLAGNRVPRSGTVIALGGGVVGDLAGFVASSYLRGVAFVQVPTTLLAMVDSSVGGKTGVNLPEGKNLVGAFHQPKLVVIDTAALASFAEGSREFPAGMAEVIKYGTIRDKKLFDRVAQGVTAVDADLAEIIETCVTIKARIVEEDEFEERGLRVLLNFGHTIGHAIEKATGYKTYLHGEAIALGMRAAAWLSVWHAGLPEDDARRIEAALVANHLPVTLKPEVDHAAILAALGNDKKVASDGRNRWVLLNSLGKATGGWEPSTNAVKKALGVIAGKIGDNG